MGLMMKGLLEVKIFFLPSEVDKRCVWLCVVAGGWGVVGWCLCGEIRVARSDSESSFVKKLVAELGGVPSSLVSFAPRRSRLDEKFKRCPQP